MDACHEARFKGKLDTLVSREGNAGDIDFSGSLTGGQLVAEASAGAVVYPALDPATTGFDYGADAAAGWTDIRADAKLFGEYRFLDWLGTNLELTYQGYFSDTQLEFDGGNGQDQLGFNRFTVFGGVRAFL